jgi:cholesterol transport system auxiliary component
MATFTLDASFPASAHTKAGPALLVSIPHARPGFDTERMAYVRSPNELEYFARNRWVDAPARMIAPLMVQALDSTSAFSAVVPAPTVARAKWRLESEIVRLQQAFFEKPSHVELVLRAQLIETTTQQPAASRVFSVTVPSASEDARGGAAAANEAVHQLLPQLAAWCAMAVGQSPPLKQGVSSFVTP